MRQFVDHIKLNFRLHFNTTPNVVLTELEFEFNLLI